MISVFIAQSINGFISDKNNSLEWLNTIPNPTNDDMGYHNFMKNIDAIIMGRKTFETVLNFGIEWPYKKPVYVLSKNLNSLAENLKNKVFYN